MCALGGLARTLEAWWVTSVFESVAAGICRQGGGKGQRLHHAMVLHAGASVSDGGGGAGHVRSPRSIDFDGLAGNFALNRLFPECHFLCASSQASFQGESKTSIDTDISARILRSFHSRSCFSWDDGGDVGAKAFNR